MNFVINLKKIIKRKAKEMKTSKLIAVFLTLVFIIALTGTAFAQYDNLVERIVKILEDTDSPLSEEQLKEIKDLPQERGFYQKLTDILEDDQNQAVRRAFGRMGAGARPLLLKGGHVVDPANNISEIGRASCRERV